MGLFTNPLSHAGYPPGVTGTPTTQPSEVRAATLAEANAGVLDNVYISPSTQAAAVALDFASPPALGFGSTTPRPVHATTLDSTGLTSLATGAGAVANIGNATGTIGFFGATAVVKQTSTTDLRTALINLGLYTTGGASPLNLNGGTLTAATVHGTTIDTNVAAAQLSLNGNTIDATGSDAAVGLNLTTKGTGSVVFAQSKAGVDQNIQITNSDNTAAAGNAGLQLAVGGSTSLGDPYVRFEISGVGASTMSMGLDNSNSDLFVISNSTALGTSNALTLTQAGALTSTTSLTATLGNITATNGDIVRGTAGNKDIYSSVASTTTAGANSAGTVTLVAGEAIVSTTAVTASSQIRLYRQGVGATGVAALGILSLLAISAGVSFTIRAVNPADATSAQAADVSVIGWEIVN